MKNFASLPIKNNVTINVIDKGTEDGGDEQGIGHEVQQLDRRERLPRPLILACGRVEEHQVDFILGDGDATIGERLVDPAR